MRATFSLVLLAFLAACISPPGCSGEAGGAPRLGPVSQRARLERSRELRAHTDEHPKDADAWFRWGVTQLELGIPRAAVGMFSRAVNLEPADPRARLFLAHSLYAMGQFGEAYEHYRRVAAARGGFEDVLARVRGRIGERPESASGAPGVAGIVSLVASRERSRLVEVALELERLEGREAADLRALDLVLLSAMARSDEWREDIEGRFLLDYARESGRALESSPGDLARELSTLRDGTSPEARRILADLVAVSAGALAGIELGASERAADPETPRPAVVLVAGESVHRSRATGEAVIDLLNGILEERESDRRLFALDAARCGRQGILCVTPRGWRFVAARSFDPPPENP